MTADFMLFSALLAVPLSAMLCSGNSLFFFILFPLAAVVQGKWMYCKRLFFLTLPPVIFLVWAYWGGNKSGYLSSIRWICAITSGTYFAAELGTTGIASVLGSVKFLPFAGRLSDLMLLAGSTAANVRKCWVENSDLPLSRRIIQSAADSVAGAELHSPQHNPVGILPLSVAVMSWVFLLISVSGITEGIAG